MKHEIILKKLLAEAENNPNTLGFLVFGSVASGTYTEQSDINTLTVLQKSKPSSGLKSTIIGGIKVGNMFFTHEILVQSLRTVPYLLYLLVEAKLLYDREDTINSLLIKINKYFDKNSEVRKKWIDYYKSSNKRRLSSATKKRPLLMLERA